MISNDPLRAIHALTHSAGLSHDPARLWPAGSSRLRRRCRTQSARHLAPGLEGRADGRTIAAGKPPIYEADDLWNQGVELTDYTIASDGELYGSNVRLQVKLNGLRKDGETIAQQVKYLVTTTPALTISREDR